MVKAFLLSTAIVSVGFSPVMAQTVSVGPVIITAAKSDETVIEELVTLYRETPASYNASLSFLREYRPYLVERFNKLTLKGPAPKKASTTVQADTPATTANSRAMRPAPTGTAKKTAGSVYEGQTALQNNGLFIALGVLGLAAAAGGGGGGGDDGTPGGLPGTKEFFETDEYKRNSGLAQINASTRYAAGGQGQNVKIAVLDTGIDLKNGEFSGKIDLANSKSYFAGQTVQDIDGHGTHVAGIAAAAKNGVGAHGVAFASQLVVYRGIAGDNDLAEASYDFFSDALTSAATAGVAVMNNSWGPFRYVDDRRVSIPITDFANGAQLEFYLKTRYGTDILLAFDKAKEANLLSIFAAGNSGLSDVGVLAGIPVLLPEYEGYFLGVVAVGDSNVIADFSNRCGIAKDFCLAAPGVGISATKLGGTGDDNLVEYSGTSMAAPHVAGAAALLLSQWPELDAPTLASLLLDTATDLGAPGVDTVYGHGLLNVAKAVRPAGTLKIYDETSTTGSTTPLAGSAIVTSSAMEGALGAALSTQSMIVGDHYDRGYAMDMDALLVSRNDGPSARMLVETRNASTGVRVAGFANQGTAFGAEQDGVRTWYGATEAVAISAGIIDHSTLLDGGTTGQVGMSLGSAIDARLTASFSNDGTGSGDAFSVGLYGSGPVRASVAVGQLNEQDQVLGTGFMGASGRDGSAETNFVSLGAGVTLGGALDIDLQAVFGQTDFTQSGLIAAGQNMASTGARLSVSQPVRGLSGARIGFNVSMPIVVTQGTVTIDVPVQRAAAVNGAASTAVIRSRQDIAFETDLQPVDVGLSFTVPLDESRNFGVQLEGGYRIVEGESSQPYAGFAFTRRF